MGRRKILLGMVVGAVAGGAAALIDKDARDYAKKKLVLAKATSSYYTNHPSEAVHSLKQTVDKLNHAFASGSSNAINALEQVEQTLDKVTNKSERKEIE